MPDGFDHLGLGQLRQVVALLRFAAEREDRIHHERALHRRERPEATVAALEFLHDETVRDTREPRAAVLLGEIRAEHAQFREFGDQLVGEAALHVAVADDRQDLLVDERANGIANRALFFSERRVDVEQVARMGGELHGRQRGNRAGRKHIEGHWRCGYGRGR
jgi:hypothetical protein